MEPVMEIFQKAHWWTQYLKTKEKIELLSPNPHKRYDQFKLLHNSLQYPATKGPFLIGKFEFPMIQVMH